ncbi:MAG: hypothetical protein KDA24_24680 [Deltaproteobacteria bacterium]|nr:hypothetical protein [Deltaproteobacteria bacterium]
MAIIITEESNDGRLQSWTAQKDTATDTTISIEHGQGIAPEWLILEPLHPRFYLNSWHITEKSDTHIVLTTTNTTGGTIAQAQIRIVAAFGHLT